MLRTLRITIMEYKYTLDKSSKKFICPNCQKRRFVKYIDIEKNNYVSDSIGRCDRETSCGYHQKPTSNQTISYVPFIEKKISLPTYHQKEITLSSCKKFNENNLFIFLSKFFSKDKILQSFTKYQIGTSKHWNGASVFWQIDTQENIHAGKVILFDKQTGKRVKEPYPHINWVHKLIKEENFVLEQCLYGLHLVPNVLQRTIAIVEAEKTALIMSLFLPDYIWLATGSKQNLKYDLLKPIKQNDIIIFPDKGEFNDWKNKSEQLNKLGFKIKCSNLIEKSDFELGTDLADVYIHEHKTKDNSLQKKAINYTETEKIINKIALKNPEIWNLIQTFDLIDKKGNGIRKI
jgi:hypothetical protein